MALTLSLHASFPALASNLVHLSPQTPSSFFSLADPAPRRSTSSSFSPAPFDAPSPPFCMSLLEALTEALSLSSSRFVSALLDG